MEAFDSFRKAFRSSIGNADQMTRSFKAIFTRGIVFALFLWIHFKIGQFRKGRMPDRTHKARSVSCTILENSTSTTHTSRYFWNYTDPTYDKPKNEKTKETPSQNRNSLKTHNFNKYHPSKSHNLISKNSGIGKRDRKISEISEIVPVSADNTQLISEIREDLKLQSESENSESQRLDFSFQNPSLENIQVNLPPSGKSKSNAIHHQKNINYEKSQNEDDSIMQDRQVDINQFSTKLLSQTELINAKTLAEINYMSSSPPAKKFRKAKSLSDLDPAPPNERTNKGTELAKIIVVLYLKTIYFGFHKIKLQLMESLCRKWKVKKQVKLGALVLEKVMNSKINKHKMCFLLSMLRERTKSVYQPFMPRLVLREENRENFGESLEFNDSNSFIRPDVETYQIKHEKSRSMAYPTSKGFNPYHTPIFEKRKKYLEIYERRNKTYSDSFHQMAHNQMTRLTFEDFEDAPISVDEKNKKEAAMKMIKFLTTKMMMIEFEFWLEFRQMYSNSSPRDYYSIDYTNKVYSQNELESYFIHKSAPQQDDEFFTPRLPNRNTGFEPLNLDLSGDNNSQSENEKEMCCSFLSNSENSLNDSKNEEKKTYKVKFSDKLEDEEKTEFKDGMQDRPKLLLKKIGEESDES